MQKRTVVCAVLVVGFALWGCGERRQKETVSGITPVLGAGQFHNEVLAAFDGRASLDGVTRMPWGEWQEEILASMEEVSVDHGIAFDRTQASEELRQLMIVFHALEAATGIEPGMLRASPDPQADFATLVGQLSDWNLIDATAVRTLARSSFEVSPVSEIPTDLRDVYDIGAGSREFWTEYAKKKSGPSVQTPPDDETPCKWCSVGSILSDVLGGLVGRVLCGNDPMCQARYAIGASILYHMVTDYCGSHDCEWGPWLPPIITPRSLGGPA